MKEPDVKEYAQTAADLTANDATFEPDNRHTRRKREAEERRKNRKKARRAA